MKVFLASLVLVFGLINMADAASSCPVLNYKQVVKLAKDNDWQLKKLNEAQLVKAIAQYNELAVENSLPTLTRNDVDGAIVAEHDGVAVVKFVFNKGDCPVGAMMTLPIGDGMKIMGRDS